MSGRSLRRFWSLDAFRLALRAAVVIPLVFAFAREVIDRPQTSLFAAFGSFTFLVLVDFGGLRRVRLVAYAGLAATGAALVALGTLCSHNSVVAAVAMLAVGFAVLFAGAFSGYVAAAANGAILLFVLPANNPAPASAIPDRLLGFALASVVGTAAALLLWPSR
ncbi:MAG: FUSC family protein, partial [Actinomycetota bacterium]